MKKKSTESSLKGPLIKRVTNLILENRLLTKGDSIIVAVSGGPDSLSLLHLLFRMNCFSLFAVYIDHGLRPDEIKDERDLLERFCNELQIPFSTLAVDVHAEQECTGSSPEEAARNLRYAALEKERVRLGASVIAVGHTADDQAEEVLLRLIRGSGLRGLSGMALKRDKIVRPLLQEKKKTLIKYLKENSLSFSNDSSNRSSVFVRNRVRLHLLPYLEENFNPSIRQNLLQTAEILRLDNDLLEQLTQKVFDTLVQIDKDPDTILRPQPKTVRITNVKFLATHPALQRRVLEKVFWCMGTAPGFKQIDQVIHLIANCSTGSEIHLGHGLRVWKSVNEAFFSHPGGEKSFRGSGLTNITISLEIETPGEYSVAGHNLIIRLFSKRPRIGHGELLLDADLVPFPLLLRTPLPGEKFRPLGATGRKKITRFLSDAKILKQHRRFFPVLLSQKRIAAVVGLRIDHEVRVREETKRFLVVGWQPITDLSANKL